MRFDLPVKNGGYAWWYIDAISDDGDHALTVIAFVGSVFSPYYAWANAKFFAPAENFCAMNVALYGRHKAWAMTERPQTHLTRQAGSIQLGASRLQWQDGSLFGELDEVTVPLPRRLRGRFSLRPTHVHQPVYTLDDGAHHRWRPVAPAARIEVAFDHPKIAWAGRAYFDTNEGDRPLTEDFNSWHWSRSAGAGEATVLYDVVRRDGSPRALALQFGPDGAAPAESPPMQDLPNGFWGIKRATRADVGFKPRVITTLEDAPFYVRSRIETQLNGVRTEAIHESLDLRRFDMRWVKLLLPFRMPRRF